MPYPGTPSALSSQPSLTVPSHSSVRTEGNPLAGSRARRRAEKGDEMMAESVRSGSRRSGTSAKTGSTFSAIKASLHVELEHTSYFPGQVVRGTVRFAVRKTTKFYALRLRVAGKESMVVRKKRYAASILTKQRETFFKELVTLEGTTKTVQTLIGQKEKYRDQYLGPRRADRGADVNGSAPVLTVEPGEYAYPFEVQLPHDLPASFEDVGEEEDYAAVFYYAKAYLDIPGGGESDLVARSFFRVVSLIGIKQWKDEAKPLAHHQEFKVEGCCGMSKGFVKVSIEVPRRLLSIADDKVIPFRAVVNNMDGKEVVRRIMVELVHVLVVTAEGEEEERRTVIAKKVVAKDIPPGSNDGIIGSLPMPEDPPPSLTGILFTSKYELVIEADVPMAKDPRSVSELTLVQRCETEEEVPRHALGKAVVQETVGLHEKTYVCPLSREVDLLRIPVPPGAVMAADAAASSGLGMMMAADDSVEFKDALSLPPQHVDWSSAPKKRPLPRWKLVPPADYRGAQPAAGDDDDVDQQADDGNHLKREGSRRSVASKSTRRSVIGY